MLRVNLSEAAISKSVLSPVLVRRYMGGSGLGAALLAERNVQNIDPLGPDNPLIWLTSPIVGTDLPSAGRFSVCAISPLTGVWGESNSGGFFGPELRFAGFDGIEIVGCSPTPVWLLVRDGVAELRDAAGLMGLDTYQTQEAIKEELEDTNVRVACIGIAGENTVKYASIMNDHGRAAGRCGLGAVMGSKNLKAIAARGSKSIPARDPEQLGDVVAKIYERTSEDIAALAIRMAGTAGYLDMATMYGDLPIRHFQVGEWEGAANLSGVRMTEEYLVRSRACYKCPIACGRETHAPKYELDRVDGPEYETLGALGAMLQIDDLEAVIHAGHLCNAFGLDTISTGVTLVLACELFERNLLGVDETDGVAFRYGDPQLLSYAIGAIARKEGFGRRLAEGSRRLATEAGVPELAATVRGLEVPMHDPRAFHGQALAYVLSARGACHMQGDMYSVDTGQVELDEAGIIPGDRLESSDAKGRTTARHMIWRALYNALDLCQFQNPGSDLVLAAVNSITGWDLTLDDLMNAGKRILAVKRWINQQRGSTGQDDRLPAFLSTPLDSGGTLGTTPNMTELLAGAYDELGWDLNGVVSDETLRALDVDVDLLSSEQRRAA
ncbi:aldehyde ferredoxin oxidoreductase family protein [Candidatus Bipolaricaulota bacterium]